jgi:membrane-bound metal-dependent hydrolase YbcI (DUF457 family)
MTWVWGVLLALLLAVVLALVLVLVTPMYVEVHYKREGKDDRMHVGVRALFGLLKFGYDVPIMAIMERRGAFVMMMKKEPSAQMPQGKRGWVTLTVEKLEKMQRQFRKVMKRIGKYKRALRKLTRTFHIQSLNWRTRFGTGDAAQTAFITGLAWGVKGILAGYLYRYFTVDKRLRYDIRPHFQAKGFSTELTCIIRFWPGKAMIAGLTLVFLWLKEGMKWRNIRSKV